MMPVEADLDQESPNQLPVTSEPVKKPQSREVAVADEFFSNFFKNFEIEIKNICVRILT